MVAKKKTVKKKVAKKKSVVRKSAQIDVHGLLNEQLKSIASYMDRMLQHSVHLRICYDDYNANMQNKYINLYDNIMSFLSKQPEPDPQWTSERLTALESQMREVRAKLLELSPELS